MLLHTLLRQFNPSVHLDGVPDLQLHGIQENSKRIGPGDLFLARPGKAADGGQYAADAAARGAVAIVAQKPLADVALPQVVLADVNAAASRLAHLFHGEPAKAVKVIGVTGTNGKTTTTYLVRHLLASIGQRCGLVGTVEIDDGRTRRESAMTTPGAVEVAELLAAMRDAACGWCAMEVSSHALDQGRVDGVAFAAAGFTNLTGDHLDYHGTMAHYADAKAKLFAGLRAPAVAAVNGDDAAADRMLRDCRGRCVHYGVRNSASDYLARAITYSAAGTAFILAGPDGEAEVRTSLIGRHNVENALLAASLVGQAAGVGVGAIAAGLRDAQGAPGRLQGVRCGQPFAVLVDYAHTDDALENVLSALRPLVRGKLRVMFGCGGDRDRTKRPRMAQAAEKLADVVYVTSDNPRTERPAAILDEIKGGFTRPLVSAAVVIEDRREAIERVIADAGEGDVVVLAGKGHENYQIVGTEKRHFDDVEEARRVLETRYAGE